MKDRIREALSALLKKKGITAEIQSVEPSNFELTAERAPGASAPAILFSILSPKITVNNVIISGAPVEVGMTLSEDQFTVNGMLVELLALPEVP